MAGVAKGVTSANEHCHTAASHALPVNEFVSMLLAETFAVAKLFQNTFLA